MLKVQSQLGLIERTTRLSAFALSLATEPFVRMKSVVGLQLVDYLSRLLDGLGAVYSIKLPADNS